MPHHQRRLPWPNCHFEPVLLVPLDVGHFHPSCIHPQLIQRHSPYLRQLAVLNRDGHPLFHQPCPAELFLQLCRTQLHDSRYQYQHARQDKENNVKPDRRGEDTEDLQR
jgi:hypothetical protein